MELKEEEDYEIKGKRDYFHQQIHQVFRKIQIKSVSINQMLSLTFHQILSNNWGIEGNIRFDKSEQSLLPDSPNVSLLVPICLGQQQFGTVSTQVFSSKSINKSEIRHFLYQFAKEASLLLNQQDSFESSFRFLGIGPGLLMQSPLLVKSAEFIRKVAQTNTSALLIGDFGTEKLHLASMIHFSSSRRNQPFLEIHCAMFPEKIFAQKWNNRLKQVEAGTLFLNGIDHLNEESQMLVSKTSVIFNERLNVWWIPPLKYRNRMTSRNKNLFTQGTVL